MSFTTSRAFVAIGVTGALLASAGFAGGALAADSKPTVSRTAVQLQKRLQTMKTEAIKSGNQVAVGIFPEPATCPSGTVLTGGGGLSLYGIAYSGPYFDVDGNLHQDAWTALDNMEDPDNPAYAIAICTSITETQPPAKPKPPTKAKPKPKAYKNCTALRKVYPHGVGRKGAKDHVSKNGKPVKNFTVSTATYKLNKKRDRDKDGIACEKK